MEAKQKDKPRAIEPKTPKATQRKAREGGKQQGKEKINRIKKKDGGNLPVFTTHSEHKWAKLRRQHQIAF